MHVSVFCRDHRAPDASGNVASTIARIYIYRKAAMRLDSARLHQSRLRSQSTLIHLLYYQPSPAVSRETINAIHSELV